MTRLGGLLVLLWLADLVLAAPPPGEAKKPSTREPMRSFQGLLALGDKHDPVLKRPAKTIPLKITKGRTYRLELSSRAFIPVLRVTSSSGKELARSEPADDKHALLLLVAPADDEIQIQVVTADNQTGGYLLVVTPQ